MKFVSTWTITPYDGRLRGILELDEIQPHVSGSVLLLRACETARAFGARVIEGRAGASKPLSNPAEEHDPVLRNRLKKNTQRKNASFIMKKREKVVVLKDKSEMASVPTQVSSDCQTTKDVKDC